MAELGEYRPAKFPLHYSNPSPAREAAARTGGNLMPHIVAAVEAHATVGEISDAMRKVFGEYKEAVVI